MDHDERNNSDDDDNLWDSPRHDKDGELLQRMEEERNHLIQEFLEPPTNEQALDDSIAEFLNSQYFKDYNRIAGVAAILDSLVRRLDKYKSVDDLWNFDKAPAKARPKLRPPLGDRSVTASMHLRKMLNDIGRATRDAVGFEDDRDIRVCLQALDKELRVNCNEHIAFAENKRYDEAIAVIKRVLKAAGRLSSHLLIKAASAEMTAKQTRADGLTNCFGASQITDAPSAAELNAVREIVRDKPRMAQRAINKELKRRSTSGLRSSTVTSCLDILRNEGVYHIKPRARQQEPKNELLPVLPRATTDILSRHA